VKRVFPRALVHRGVVEAAGFLVEKALPGAVEARRRVLSLWSPGARVYGLPEGWLLVLPRPVRVRCDRAPGLPLVEVESPAGRALAGMPLSPAQIRALAPPDGAVLRLRRGTVVLDLPAEGEAVDPAAWLATGDFGVVSTAPLGDPPDVPHLEEAAKPAFDTRQHLRGIPPPDPRLSEVLTALGRRKAAPGGPARRPQTSLRWNAPAHWLHGLAWSLRGLWRAPRTAGDRAPGRTALRLQPLLTRMVIASRLSRLVGRRQAAYIQRMMEMFERGDLQEALRHAIPLSAGEALRGLALLPPSPRPDLRIRPGGRRSSAPVSLAPDLYSELQRIYRQAFHRLEAQDRVEEAAFLLAEVLHADEEAVAFLERHGRLRIAAELAEARNLPPGLVVRQWFLAGDRGRARKIARRSGAFADAVTRLERSRQHGEARELRRLWAESLAAAGDYAAAVDVVWPVAGARDQALAWMDKAIEQGGPPAGRMLARKLAAMPEQFETIRGKVVEILESWRAEGAATRLAFAEALLLGPATPEAATLARAAVRSIARDSGRLGARMPPDRFRQLVAFAGDGALRADAPALAFAAQEPWTTRDEVRRVEIAASDAGTMPAHDAAFLPNGLTAVALGEAGVRLVSRTRRTVAEIDQPAHRLIASDHGDRLLALARRGDAWRLARIDVPARRGELWCDARVDTFAPDYDGALWFVVSGPELLAAETAARRLGGTWGVPDLPGSVLSLARSPSRCSLLLAAAEPQIWTYELPSLTLRLREPAGLPGDWRLRARHLAVSPDGILVEQSLGFDPGRKPALRLRIHGRFDLDIPLSGESWLGEPAVTTSWIASPVHSAEGTRVYLTHLKSARVRLEVTLGRAGRVTLRLTPKEVTLSDDRGRVLVLDLEHGLMRRDLRL
jgi:hypothetical protein